MGAARPWYAVVLGLVVQFGAPGAGGQAAEAPCAPALGSGPVGVQVALPAGPPGEGRSLRLTLEAAARVDVRGPCDQRHAEAGSPPVWEGAGLYDALKVAVGFEAAVHGLQASARVAVERVRVDVMGRSTEEGTSPLLSARSVRSAFSGTGLGTSIRMVVEHQSPRWSVGAGTLLEHLPSSGPAEHAVTYEGYRATTWSWSGRGRHVRQIAAMDVYSAARGGSIRWGGYLHGGEGRTVFDFAAPSSVLSGPVTRAGPGLWGTASEAVRALGVGIGAQWRPVEAVSVEAALGPVWARRQTEAMTATGNSAGAGGQALAVHEARGEGAHLGHSLYLALRLAPAGRLALGLAVSRIDVSSEGEGSVAGLPSESPVVWEQGLHRVWLAVPGARSALVLPADGRLRWVLSVSVSL